MNAVSTSALLLIGSLLLASGAGAYETDQFTQREQPLEDSRELLNNQVNIALAAIAANWDRGVNEPAFTAAVYWRLGGLGVVDHLERWALESPKIDKHSGEQHIYDQLPLWVGRSIAIKGISATIRLNGYLTGTDKLGHFFSQGRKFYRRYRRSSSEARAAQWATVTERGIFGQWTTGIFSNADLVANYEGHRFYRSLFEDDAVPGKPAIVVWNNRRPVIQRAFDWADHVNALWDEALNPNDYDRLLRPYMRRRLVAFCPLFHSRPELFRLEEAAQLRGRYLHIGLRDTDEFRLDRLCGISHGP